MALTLEELSIVFSADTTKLRAALGDMGGQLNKVEEKARKTEMAAHRLSSAVAGIFTFRMAKSFLDASMAMDRMQNALLAVTGTAAGAKGELDFISREADRLGLSLQTTAGSYVKFMAAAKGTNLEGQASRDIFIAVAEAATVLGLSSDEASGALMAIQQMVSKGNVQAEELRGQLGERLPGAVQIMARAMGVGTSELNKMLEQGQILAADVLPKMAVELKKTFGAGLENAMKSTQADMNRMASAWFKLRAAMDSGPAAGMVFRGLAKVMNELTEAMTTTSVSGMEIQKVMLELQQIFLEVGNDGVIAFHKIRNAFEEFNIKTGSKNAWELLDIKKDALEAADALKNMWNAKFGAQEGRSGKVWGWTAGSATNPERAELEKRMANILKMRDAELKAIDDVKKADYVAFHEREQRRTELAKTIIDLEKEIADAVSGKTPSGSAGGTAAAQAESVNAAANKAVKELADKYSDLTDGLRLQNQEIQAEIAGRGEMIPMMRLEAELRGELSGLTAAQKNEARGLVETYIEMNKELEAQEKRNRAMMELAQEIREQEERRIGTRDQAMRDFVQEEKERGFERMNKLRSEAMGIVDSLATAEERLARNEATLMEAMSAGIINADQYTNAIRRLHSEEEELSEAFQSLSSGFADAFGNAAESIILDSESIGDSLINLAKELERVILQALLLEPLKAGLKGGIGAMLKGEAFGAAFSAGVMSMFGGGAGAVAGSVGTAVGGNVVSGGSGFIIPPQANIPFNPGGAGGVLAAPGAKMTVNVIDQRGSGEQISTKESMGADGQRQIDILIRDKVREGLETGSYDRTMRNVWGLNRKGST